MSRLNRVSWLLLLLPWALLSACSGVSPPAPTATLEPLATAAPPTPAPSATAAPVPASQLQPDGQRILSYVQKLADEIGPRPAGTAKEQAAIDFLAGQLRSFGYDVSIQEFPVSSEASRAASVTEKSPSQRAFTSALPFTQSGAGAASGRLVPAGLGAQADFPAAVAGNIALIQRGTLTFQEKVSNAMAAGAKGVIVFNNEPGSFLGTLSQGSNIPAVSISQADGQSLMQDAQAGAEADISVGPLQTSAGHNVIAKPPGKECETVTGGHYDSVPQAPGASDNATGTATTIEIASLMAKAGQMGSNCFILFGAEENGLVGSRAWVNSLTAAQKDRLRFMLNLDMVGVGDEFWGIIGNANLQGQAIDIGTKLGFDVRRFALSGASSDHASFINAGIPAVFLYRLNDPLLHTPQDVSPRVRPDLLEQAAKMGIAFLGSFTTPGG